MPTDIALAVFRIAQEALRNVIKHSGASTVEVRLQADAGVIGLTVLDNGKGLDATKWFDNVELVAAKRIGRETVQFVSNVFKYYIAYKLSIERTAEREAAKKKPV